MRATTTMNRKWLLIFILSFLAFRAGAETRFNREKWKELRDGLHYKKAEQGGEDEELEEWSSESKKRNYGSGGGREYEGLREKPREVSRKNEGVTIPEWLVYVVYAVAGVALLVVIYFIFFRRKAKPGKKVVKISQEELTVEKPFDELTELLKASIEKQNFREAIRIYFIFIIKTLREKGWITWEKKKTNTAYLFEMRKRSSFDSFSQVTLLFEIIWYGNRPVSRDQFEQIRPKFDALLNLIRSSHE